MTRYVPQHTPAVRPQASIHGRLMTLLLRVLVVMWLVQTGLALVLGIASHHLRTRRLRARMTDDLLSQGMLLVRNNSHALRQMALDNAFSSVSRLVAATVRDRDVVYGIYMDSDMRPWVRADSSNPSGTIDEPGSLRDSASRWAHGLTTPSYRWLSVGGRDVIEFAAPVLGNQTRLGTIRYGVGTRSLRSALSSMTWQLRAESLIAPLTLFFAALTALGLAMRSVGRQTHEISKPLSELAEAASAMSAGDYSVTVRAEGSDEVGVLARAFERMREEIKRHTEDLEANVRERTSELEARTNELQELACRYRTLVENAPIGIGSVDRHGCVIAMNATMQSMLWPGGCPGGRAACLTDSGAIAGRAVAEDLVHCLEEQQTVVAERETNGCSHEKRHFRYHLTPLDHECTDGATVLVVIEETTRYHALEQRFRESEKLRTLGQLAGGVAHDFNNMLGVILGYADLIGGQVGGGEHASSATARYGGKIHEAAVRASELVKQLLAFSRQGKYEHKAIDLHRTIADVAEILGHTINRNITIVQQLHAEAATVLGDAAQLQNMILNLAVNARDAMPDGGALRFETSIVTIDAACGQDAANDLGDGRYVRLDIADTGVGMDMETQAHALEPFYTTKGPGKGTGLGLPSAYGIAKGHGGAMDIVSAPNEGTTISVYLPVGDAAVTGASSAPFRARRGNGTVLVIDDEESMRDVAGEMLREMGYEVLTAADGREGAEQYRRQDKRIDVVIVDMIMPVMSGPECIRELLQADSGVRIVVASGYALDTQTRSALGMGVKCFLHKPFDAAALSEAVAWALGADEGSGAGAGARG